MNSAHRSPIAHQPIGMTMCSGIGAPELAAPWVDWRFASEIEPFPREVLQHRFGYLTPDDHQQGAPLLWGDMTDITPELLRRHGLPLPELIVAGTPCQAFSVAGARKGLEDARGNLTLKFVEILHEIVTARPDGRLAVLWENVPGVLSDKGNAFGCFLGGIVGAMDAIVPSPCPPRGKSSEHWRWHKGGKFPVIDDNGDETDEYIIREPHHALTWPSEGMVEGPWARAAWSVLDAQWFGVAQRRRRVFVVVDFGNAIDPAAVLLEPDRMRGDHPPRREARKGTSRGIEIGPSGGCFTDVNTTLDTRAKDGPIRNQLAGAAFVPAISMCLNAGAMGRIDSESETFIPVQPVSIAMRGRDDGAQIEVGDDCAFTLRASTGGGDKPHVFAPIAFDCKGTEVQTSCDGSHPTLRSMGHSQSHQNAGGHAAVCFAIQERAVSENPKAGPDGAGFRGDGTAYTLEARTVPQAVSTPWAVRRLTPTECERLQGMPDNHTLIPQRTRRKLDQDELARLRSMGIEELAAVFGSDPAAFAGCTDDELMRLSADGPRYKALGNSMAVPVVRWIMDRMRLSMGESSIAAHTVDK